MRFLRFPNFVNPAINMITCLGMLYVLGAEAHATSVRTFVASTGNDSNTSSNCGRSAPCRTLAGAYTVTQAGGEIVTLDSAGYGPISITTSLSITGAENSYIAVSANSVGVQINAGASGLVILRNLQISGAGAQNTTGVALTTGRLVLQDSILKFLTTGLTVSSTKADVINCALIGNVTAVSTTGTGVDYEGGIGDIWTTGPTQVRISGGNVIDNTTAFLMNSPGVDSGPNSPMNRVTIFLQYLSSTNDTLTNVSGNATMVAGTGTGCPADSTTNCNWLGGYSSQSRVFQPH